MRRLIKIALVALGIRAFLRWRKRRRAEQEPAPAPVTAETADPAEDLRRKLAESRVDAGADSVEAPDAASVEERRAAVHAEARAAVDEMTPTNED